MSTKNNLVNTDLLCLLILYVRSQDELYINYHEGFITLADWLYPQDIEAVDVAPILLGGYPAELAPDICNACLAEQPETIGGRVRHYCPTCQGNIAWKDVVLHTIWEYRFCEILHVTAAYFDYHLAHALRYIKATTTKHKQSAAWNAWDNLDTYGPSA